MINQHSRGLSNVPSDQVEHEKFEDLKRNKSDIEDNQSKILKIIKNEEEGSKKRGRRPKWSKQETELVGLIENFFTQYQSLYTLCDRLTAENSKIVTSRIHSGVSTSFCSSSSDSSDYFSSNDVESSKNSPQTEHHHHEDEMEGLRDQLNVMHKNLEFLSEKNKKLDSQMECMNQQLVDEQGFLETRMREQSEYFAGRMMTLEKELETRCIEKEKLEKELIQKNYEIKKLEDKNKSLEGWCVELKKEVTHAGEELDCLQIELDYYKKEKMRLEIQNERKQKEYSEKGIEELVEDIQGQIDDSMRILYKRIHVAEHLHDENKDGYKMVKDIYEEGNKMVKENITIREVSGAGFGGLVDDKEEKVEELEEGEENLDVMKLVTELEEKVGMLEKRLQEKDEDLVNLGETKREAIKQLCFVNEYYRERWEFLKDLIAKKNTLVTRA